MNWKSARADTTSYNPTIPTIASGLGGLEQRVSQLLDTVNDLPLEQTVRERLPEGFQRSEFLLDHGAIDMIVDRRQLREELADLIAKIEKRPAPAP